MRPGHENCAADEYVERMLCDPEPRFVRVCLHEHKEQVQADDGNYSGPVVADYCHCCDRMMVREGFR